MIQSATRVIGSFDQGNQGTAILFIAGIHGNEPSGVHALERVFSTLNHLRPEVKGKMLGLVGNPVALDQKARYIDKDMNRVWSKSELARILGASISVLNTEERELRALLPIIDEFFACDHPNKVLIDLHTTSGPGGMFSIVSLDAVNRELASALHAPVIFNLTRKLDCTLNIFMDNRLYNGLAFEGGQHDDPSSIDHHEAAIWILLEKLNLVHPDEIPDFFQYHERLIRASRNLPHFMEVIYRHEITREDRFRMYPGFTNFHQVYKGEPLARDKNGEIFCPDTGYLLMPLYQNQGEDGFFIVKKITDPPA